MKIKKDDFLKAMGQIRDDYVLEADPRRKTGKKPSSKWAGIYKGLAIAGAAAAVCVIGFVGVMLIKPVGSSYNGGRAQEAYVNSPEEKDVYSPEAKSTKTQDESGNAGEVPPTMAPIDPDAPRFFGRKMTEELVALNEKTLLTPGSGLYDVLTPRLYSEKEILDLIYQYKVPDTFYLHGQKDQNGVIRGGIQGTESDRQFFEDLREQCVASFGKGDANRFVAVEYGILTGNADVRSFPTMEFVGNAANSWDGEAVTVHDLFQETRLFFGSGVQILLMDAQKEWAFVQGEFYNGWVQMKDIALCDEASYKEFLLTDEVAVSLGRNQKMTYDRLGVILPLIGSTENSFTVKMPVRDENGRLQTETVTLTGAEAAGFRKGFAPYSGDEVIRLACIFEGTPYDWGDGNGFYDCSSFAQALYRVFGIYLPRNSSAMKNSGLQAADLSGLSREARLKLVGEHPGAVIVMPGHIMIAGKVETGKHAVIHATTTVSLKNEEGVFEHVEFYQVVKTYLEDMKTTQGETPDVITWLLWVE